MDQAKVKGILRFMGRRVADNSASLLAFFNKNHVEPKDYLFVLTNELYDENSCLTAIKSLSFCGKVDFNERGDFGYNFIQNAMYSGYSNEFVMALLSRSDYGYLDINHKDDDGDTMLHTAIYANDTCYYNIEELYGKLIDCGFDSTIKDKEGRNIVDAMKYEKRRCNKFSDEQIKKVEKIFVENVAKKNKNSGVSALDRVLSAMGYNLTANEKILRRELPKLGISRESYLLELTDVLHNELCCFAALKSLISSGDFDVNKVEDGYNFIQNALYAGYGTAFIIGCIDASMNSSLKNKLNINHVDDDGDTILHSAIYANDVCVIDVAALYKTLLKYGFDSNIKNNELKTIVDAMEEEKKRCNKFSNSQIVEVEHIYDDALGYYDDSFSKDEQLKNEKLDDIGLNNFLKNCRR